MQRGNCKELPLIGGIPSVLAVQMLITWMEFRNAFRSHHVPAGLMKLKKKKFLSLKQGGMSIAEYRDKFIQLSRYAPTKVEMMRRGRNYSWKV